MKLLTLGLALAFSLSVFAETKLATITSDTTTDQTVFFIDTNADGSAAAMHYVTTNEAGAITEDVHSRIDEVLNGGVVLRVMEGREIIRLFLESFNATTGGTVRLQFLTNGVTGAKGSYSLKLEKRNGTFVLADAKGNLATALFVKGNWSRILRRWIGVDFIEASTTIRKK